MRIASIDPGMKGAVGLVDTITKECDVFALPTVQIASRNTIEPYKLRTLLEFLRPDIVVIEWVVPMGEKDGRKRGIKTTGDFMYGAGILFGVAAGLGIQVDFVSPMRWKRAQNLLGRTKKASQVLASRKFPRLASFLLKRRPDFAEALLMCDWFERFGLHNFVVGRLRTGQSTEILRLHLRPIGEPEFV